MHRCERAGEIMLGRMPTELDGVVVSDGDALGLGLIVEEQRRVLAGVKDVGKYDRSLLYIVRGIFAADRALVCVRSRYFDERELKVIEGTLKASSCVNLEGSKLPGAHLSAPSSSGFMMLFGSCGVCELEAVHLC
jgi:hypothetical protein